MQNGSATPDAFWIFARAMAIGFAWSVATLALIGGVTVAMVTASDWSDLPREALEGAVWAAFGASVFGIVPTGPIAGVAAWLLYRRGVTAPWAYSLAQAGSAVAGLAVAVGAAIMTLRNEYVHLERETDSALLIAAVIAAANAFGGFMMGRIIRAAATTSGP